VVEDAGLDDALLDEALLDNPAWQALTGSQRHLGVELPRAARYRPNVAPFAGLLDASDPLAWNDLGRLVASTGPVAIGDTGPGVPEDWTVLSRFPAVQMVLRDSAGSSGTREPSSGREGRPDGLRPLGEADVPSMMELVHLTNPGPFERGTIAFGGYLGIWRGPRLVAMAGRRMSPGGWVEISAVCTDPEFQGQGLARQLLAVVLTGIRDQGRRPFLHAMKVNIGAISLYESIGFSTRREVEIVVVNGPAEE
jgi:ribosomal protein S18 acetylase RimI-like enzyme